MTAKPSEVRGGAAATVDHFIAIAAKLIRLMERETRLLTEMRPGEVAPLLEEKARLIQAYEDKAREFRDAPERLSGITAALREEFERIVRRFDAALTRNANALLAAQEANQRLLKAIVDAVAEKTAGTPSYAPDGALRKPHKSASHGVSLTLNQEL